MLKIVQIRKCKKKGKPKNQTSEETAQKPDEKKAEKPEENHQEKEKTHASGPAHYCSLRERSGFPPAEGGE